MNQLRVLDLSNIEIEELPESVSSLENLHMLYLGRCKKLKRVPSLAKLKNLRCLDLNYTCIEELPEGIEELVELRSLYLEETEIEELPESVSSLENLHMLDLNGCKKLKRVPSLAKIKNLRCLDLSYTCIEELPEGMEELVELRYLFLEEMPDLKGTLLHGTLANLQHLRINGCPKLKNLFSLGTLQSLQSLGLVEISHCIAMEEVVSREEDDKTGFNTVVTLPNLMWIKLSNLPALQSICSRTMVCSSLTYIHIISCCKLKKIPLIIDKPRDDFSAFLKGTREWWDALDWADLAHTKDLLKSSIEIPPSPPPPPPPPSEDESKEEELKGKSDKLGEIQTNADS